MKLYERIHKYAIEYEVVEDRIDFIMPYLKLVLEREEFGKGTKILKAEIDFLLQSDKCKKQEICVWIIDIVLISMAGNDSLTLEKYLSYKEARF